MKRALIPLILLALQLTPAQAQDRWTGFLGGRPQPADGLSVPTAWSPTENIAWTRETPGYGQSSPVIWDDHVYLTAVDGPNKETLHVLCFSLKTGELLWDHTHASTFPEKSSVYISRAAPTPVVDAQGIYAYFESGDVIALAHDGSSRWAVSLTERFGPPENEFGLAASPVQLDDRLFILVDNDGPSYLTALGKNDGQERWTTKRTSRRSWSSPMLVPFGDSVQIVCSSDGSVDGYDVETGKQLWTYTEVGGNTSTSPVPVGVGTFMVAASPGRDGKNAEMARKSNGLFQVQHGADGWQPAFAWTSDKPTPSWASPIVHRGLAYWVNRRGVVYCFDAKTGETTYTERIPQSCWATPVGVGDHLYVFGRDGLTTVLAAGPEFEIVAENTLWTEEAPPANHLPTNEEETEERRRAAAMFSRPTVYGVALVDGTIVLRTGSQVYCIRAASE